MRVQERFRQSTYEEVNHGPAYGQREESDHHGDR